MADGRLIGEGSETDIIAGTTAVAVRTDDWAAAFAPLNAASQPVMLAGRTIRVADGDPDELRGILTGAGLSASFEAVPATIEERMVILARHRDAA
jgi:hypothetical protein